MGLRRGVLFGAIGSVAGVVAARRAYEAIMGRDKREPSSSARTYILEQETTVDAPLADVFPLFAQPENLARITPPSMEFEILSVENTPMQPGTTMEYRIRIGGVPQRWRTLISEYEPPRRFVDVQERGPFRYWRHEHSFEERAGRTIMRDRVEYQLPLGVLGRLALPIVAQQLQGIFAYRARVIEELWPGQRTSVA